MGVACTLPPSHLPPQALPNWSDQWLLPESQAPVASLTHGNQTAQVVTWASARPPVSSQRPPGRGGEGRSSWRKSHLGPGRGHCEGLEPETSVPCLTRPQGLQGGPDRGQPPLPPGNAAHWLPPGPEHDPQPLAAPLYGSHYLHPQPPRPSPPLPPVTTAPTPDSPINLGAPSVRTSPPPLTRPPVPEYPWFPENAHRPPPPLAPLPASVSSPASLPQTLALGPPSPRQPVPGSSDPGPQ